jgi:transcriptional regulator with XRE-family HTH domain
MNATEQAREITNQIIAEAKRRNLTAGQLELKWGVTKSYVSVIMRGQRVPYLGTLDRIAKAMGIKDEIKIG